MDRRIFAAVLAAILVAALIIGAVVLWWGNEQDANERETDQMRECSALRIDAAGNPDVTVPAECRD